MDTTTHDDHDVRDGGRRTVVEARIVAPNDPLPEPNGTTPPWDDDNTSLETQHHDLHDGVMDILREAAHAVRAERQWCIALRQLLAKAQAAFRALGADSEGLDVLRVHRLEHPRDRRRSGDRHRKRLLDLRSAVRARAAARRYGAPPLGSGVGAWRSAASPARATRDPVEYA